jgi:hypothetical protein
MTGSEIGPKPEILTLGIGGKGFPRISNIDSIGQPIMHNDLPKGDPSLTALTSHVIRLLHTRNQYGSAQL